MFPWCLMSLHTKPSRDEYDLECDEAEGWQRWEVKKHSQNISQ